VVSTERGHVYHGLVVLLLFGVYLRECTDLLFVCGVAFRRFITVIRFFRRYSVKVFKWLIVAVVIMEEKLKVALSGKVRKEYVRSTCVLMWESIFCVCGCDCGE